MKAARSCETCDADLTGRHSQARFCGACSYERSKKASAVSARKAKTLNDNETSRKLTRYAVKIGFLPHPSLYICMDCKWRQAQCYDHRDYSKPLDVDAVCLACNSHRHRGIPFVKPKPTEAA